MKTIANYFVGMMIVASASCQEVRKVEVTVTEESGTPIENANVGVYYLARNPDHDKEVAGMTDGAGKFVARSVAMLRMEVSIHKDGYYATHSGRLSRSHDHNLTYVLRKVRKPVALYAKNAELRMPMLGKPCGYDFSAGDWVAPSGVGKATMCYFQMETSVVSDNNYTQRLLVWFPNAGDGILAIDPDLESQESDFKWIYQAPKEGFQPKLEFVHGRTPDNDKRSNFGEKSYAIRVNTKQDENGNVISANYVRVARGIDLFGVLSKSPGFHLCFYYNPIPGDRNLEFDPKRNLFNDLDITEMVHKP